MAHSLMNCTWLEASDVWIWKTRLKEKQDSWLKNGFYVFIDSCFHNVLRNLNGWMFCGFIVFYLSDVLLLNASSRNKAMSFSK